MRSWSDGGPLGRIGRQCVCYLASRRPPRAAVRLHRNFLIVRWFGRGLALPLAPQGGATSGDGILSDFGGIVAAKWPDLLLRSSSARDTVQARGDRHGPCASMVGHRIDSG